MTPVRPLSSCVSLIFFAILVAANPLSVLGQTTQAQQKADPDPARFESEIAIFEAADRQNSAPKDAVLFVGSSSIRKWQTAECFPELTVINRGFGGSHTSDVNFYVPRIVFKYTPRTIVFYAGDNDVADGKTPEQVVRDFERFVELIQAVLPQARIVYLPVKPSPARWNYWPQMQQVNSIVASSIAQNKQVKYIDTATPLLDTKGQPRRELFLDDGLHMNDQGYQLWSDVLRDELGKRP